MFNVINFEIVCELIFAAPLGGKLAQHVGSQQSDFQHGCLWSLHLEAGFNATTILDKSADSGAECLPILLCHFR
jgi:hypothetical protein